MYNHGFEAVKYLTRTALQLCQHLQRLLSKVSRRIAIGVISVINVTIIRLMRCLLHAAVIIVPICDKYFCSVIIDIINTVASVHGM